MLPYRFIASRLSRSANGEKSISKPIIRIAVGGIALGTIVMIATLAIVNGFQNEIKNKVIGFGSHISVLKYDNNQSFEPSPISLDSAVLRQIKAHPEVNHIQVFATKNGVVSTESENEGIVVKGVGADYDFSFLRKHLLSGTIVPFGVLSTSKNTYISKILSDKLDLQVGDKMMTYFVNRKAQDSTGYIAYEQRVRDFIVAGIYETGFEELDNKTVFVDITQLQKLNYWSAEQFGGFEISLNSIETINETGNFVNEVIGPQLFSQTVIESNPGLFSWLELMDQNAIIVIGLMLIVSGVNMVSALLILILERTNMIGLLKALGCSNKDIRTFFLKHALSLTAKGIIIGNCIGVLLCIIQINFKPFKLDKQSYYIDYIPVDFNWLHLVMLNGGTFMVCMLLMLLPTIIISKITPVKSIRFQ